MKKRLLAVALWLVLMMGYIPALADEVDYAIWYTDVVITLPSNAYLVSETSELIIWKCPSNSLYLGFTKCDYFSLPAWETSLKQDGYSTRVYQVGEMEFVSGMKYNGSAYTYYNFYNYGDNSYCIYSMNLTASQVYQMDNYIHTMRIESDKVAFTQKYRFRDSAVAMYLVSDMEYYNTVDRYEQWASERTKLYLLFDQPSTPNDLHTIETQWKWAGMTTLKATYDGISTVTGYQNRNGTYVLECRINYGGKGYCMMASGLNEERLGYVLRIIGTLHVDSGTDTEKVQILDSNISITWPSDMYLYSQTSTSQTWYSPYMDIMIGFKRQNLSSLAQWKTACELNGMQTSIGYSGAIPVVAGLLYESQLYDLTYFFNDGNYSYSVTGVALTRAQAMEMTQYAETFNYVLPYGEVPVPEQDTMIFPANTQMIGTEAFVGAWAGSVILPEGIEIIGSRAFAECGNLKWIYIPSSVEEIAEDAFDNCDELMIYGERYSVAKDYAVKHEIGFTIVQ